MGSSTFFRAAAAFGLACLSVTGAWAQTRAFASRDYDRRASVSSPDRTLLAFSSKRGDDPEPWLPVHRLERIRSWFTRFLIERDDAVTASGQPLQAS